MLEGSINARKLMNNAKKLNQEISDKLIERVKIDKSQGLLLKKIQSILSSCKNVESSIKVNFPQVWNDQERFCLLLRGNLNLKIF